jgi:AraC family transcriptional regulator, dual regulator of chb operon
MRDVPCIRWASLVDSDSHCHIARHAGLSPVSPRHTHDFGELFWVEEGSAVHELSDDRADVVNEGDLVVVRPQDVHRFRSPSPDFAIVNVAFPHSTLVDLRERYYPHGGLLWDSTSSRRARPPPATMTRLRAEAAELASGPATRLRRDRFLLGLLSILEGPVPDGGSLPTWLHGAITRWQADSDAMAAGVSGIAALAGRTREHVSRVIKQATGRRAIDIVNGLRTDAAAALLRMTDRPIATIAIDVGLPNLSHFYHVFRQRFGTTPHRYRTAHQRLVYPLSRSPSAQPGSVS